MKFRLLNGRHSENGVDYKPGDIVTSDHLLTEIFKFKFERLVAGTDAAPQARRKPSVDPTPPAPVEDDAVGDPASEMDQPGYGDDSPTDSVLTPVHKGRGRWVVENEDGERINDGYLSKQEAFDLAGQE